MVAAMIEEAPKNINFLPTAEDQALIDRLREHTGAHRSSEIIRMGLRALAREIGAALATEPKTGTEG